MSQWFIFLLLFFLSSSFHPFSFSKVVLIMGPMKKAQSYNPRKYFELLLIMKENIKWKKWQVIYFSQVFDKQYLSNPNLSVWSTLRMGKEVSLRWRKIKASNWIKLNTSSRHSMNVIKWNTDLYKVGNTWASRGSTPNTPSLNSQLGFETPLSPKCSKCNLGVPISFEPNHF
jgi:hypothetical protein